MRRFEHIHSQEDKEVVTKDEGCSEEGLVSITKRNEDGKNTFYKHCLAFKTFQRLNTSYLNILVGFNY